MARIEHQRRSLPELERIAELESNAAASRSRRIEVQTRVSDLSEDQRQAENEVEQVRARRDRNSERMNSGAVTNPKDLEGLQHEMTALDRRISTLEDDELEVMEALEQAQNQLADIDGELETINAELTELGATRDDKFAELDAQSDSERQERARLAEAVPDELMTLYERLRGQYGVGAASLRRKQCQGCRLEINDADLREIATSPADEVVRCPECNRILVRTDESGL